MIEVAAKLTCDKCGIEILTTMRSNFISPLWSDRKLLSAEIAWNVEPDTWKCYSNALTYCPACAKGTDEKHELEKRDKKSFVQRLFGK